MGLFNVFNKKNNAPDRLFGAEEVNTSRQFEFDMAKALCILEMVFCHCFEESLRAEPAGESSALFFLIVVILDCILAGGGTFMGSMGLGIAYSRKDDPAAYIRRGFRIFLQGYALNLVRFTLPDILLSIFGIQTWEETAIWAISCDVLQFAGLALLLFGLLKKANLSDRAMFLVALAMSVTGSFVRFIETGFWLTNELLGLFIGTIDPFLEDSTSCFPLLNWFIVVVNGYLYGKAMRRCRDKDRYYKIALPVSGIVLAAYMIFAIPRRFGMINESLRYFYQLTTQGAFIQLLAMIFMTSVYHFIGKLFSPGFKKLISRLSGNINRVYCIHWVIIGWIDDLIAATDFEGFGEGTVIVIALLIYIVSNIIAEYAHKIAERRKSERRSVDAKQRA